MRRFVLIFVCAFLSIGVVSCSERKKNDTQRGIKNEIPDFIVPLVVRDDERDVAFANAVLADKEFGIFVTNAHVFASGQQFNIQIGGGLHPLEAREEWVDWETDLAFMRIAKTLLARFSSVAEFSEVPEIGSSIIVQGHIFRNFADSTWMPVMYSVKCRVINNHSGFGISFFSQLDVLELKIKQFGGQKIRKEDLHMLYQNFVAIRRERNENNEFQSGLSGSPAFTKSLKVAGIISSANIGRAVIVPREAVKKLLEKVRKTLKKYSRRGPSPFFFASTCLFRYT